MISGLAIGLRTCLSCFIDMCDDRLIYDVVKIENDGKAGLADQLARALI